MKPRSTRSMMWRLTPERRTCAPIMRMRAAPADLAVERRAATAARSGCSNGGVGSLRESQRSRCKSCWRSASGFSSRRERSNCSYRLMVGEEHRQEDLPAEVVGDDVIGAHLDQVAALPGTGVAAFGFVGGQAHGEGAGAFELLDLHGAIAEADQMVGAHAGKAEDALDEDAFGKGVGVGERAVDADIEIAGEVEEGGFLLEMGVVGAAGEVEAEAAGAQVFEQGAGAGDEVPVRSAAVVAELLNAQAGDGEEADEELLLVVARIEGRAAAQCDLFGQGDHLIESVLAGEAPDEGLDGAAEIFLAFTGVERGKDFEHHRQHDAAPSGADERDGAVEIE